MNIMWTRKHWAMLVAFGAMVLFAGLMFRDGFYTTFDFGMLSIIVLIGTFVIESIATYPLIDPPYINVSKFTMGGVVIAVIFYALSGFMLSLSSGVFMSVIAILIGWFLIDTTRKYHQSMQKLTDT